MATSITDFNKAFRSIRYKVYYDLNDTTIFQPNNWRECTDYLDNFTSLEYILGGVFTGIVDHNVSFTLYGKGIDQNIMKKGNKIKIIISISSDNWASSYDYNYFEGVIVGGSLVGMNTVEIKAKSYLAYLIDTLKVPYYGYIGLVGGEFSAFFLSLFPSSGWIGLTKGGSPFNNSLELSNYSTTTSVLALAKVKYYYNIIEMCKACNYLLKQIPNNWTKMQGINMENTNLGDLSSKTIINLDSILDFKFTKNIGYNQVKTEYLTLNTANGWSEGIAWENLNITGVKIAGGETLLFVAPDNDNIIYLSFFYTADFFPDTGFDDPDNSTTRCQFATADDGTGFLNNNIGIEQSIFIDEKNNTKYLLKIQNFNTTARYLKKLSIRGSHRKIINRANSEVKNTGLIAANLAEVGFELKSTYIIESTQAQQLGEGIINSYPTNKNTYSIIIKARPNIHVGDIISFQLVDLTYKYGRVLEIDSEISRDRGFEQTILVKEV